MSTPENEYTPTTEEFEIWEQEFYRHQPVISMHDGGVAGCQCLDRVFYRKTEDWGTHLAQVMGKLLAAHDAATRVAALEEAEKIAEDQMLFPILDYAEYNEAVEDVVAALRVAKSTPAHRCDSCVDCLHDGHKCCGCFDGVCCIRATKEETP